MYFLYYFEAVGSHSNISQLVTKNPPENIIGFETTKLSLHSFPYTNAWLNGGRLLISLSDMSPPPIASNNILNPFFSIAYLYCYTQF